MKKNIAKILNETAAKLPTVFNVEQDFVEMSGAELKLTPIADRQELKDDAVYQVPIPKYVAVFHEQQLKDAYKQGGAKAVQDYINKVLQP